MSLQIHKTLKLKSIQFRNLSGDEESSFSRSEEDSSSVQEKRLPRARNGPSRNARKLLPRIATTLMFDHRSVKKMEHFVDQFFCDSQKEKTEEKLASISVETRVLFPPKVSVAHCLVKLTRRMHSCSSEPCSCPRSCA